MLSIQIADRGILVNYLEGDVFEEIVDLSQLRLICKDVSFSWLVNEEHKVVGVELYPPRESHITAKLAEYYSQNPDRIRLDACPHVLLVNPEQYSSLENCDFGDYYYEPADGSYLLILLPSAPYSECDFKTS